MAIWVHKDCIDLEVAGKIAEECTVIEELNSYSEKMGNLPRQVLMFKMDQSKQFVQIPAFIAKKYGFKPNNPSWQQVFTPIENLGENNRQVTGQVTNNEQKSYRIFPEFTGKLRDYQEEMLPEMFQYLNDTLSFVLGIPPGYGKTIMSAYFIWYLQLLGCVICKQSKVYSGWITTFNKVLPDAKVWCVGDNDGQFRTYDINGNVTYSGFHIILCMNERVDKIPLGIKLRVGTFIIDEVHTISTFSQVDTFLDFYPKYIIFASATFEASTLWRMAALCSGEHGVYRISKIPHYVFAVKTSIYGKPTITNGNVVPSSIQKSLLQDKLRMNIILSLIFNHCRHRKIIVLQKLTEGIDQLQAKVRELGISADTLYGTKKSYNQSQVLVGTVQKMGTGFDEENACADFKTIPIKSNTLILANSILSKYLYYQCVGRVMRCAANDNPDLVEVPAIIYLIDNNSNVKNNFKALEPFIRESMGVIYHVDYRTPFIPPKHLYFQDSYTPGYYYKVLSIEEYHDLHEYGIYLGNIEEQKQNYVLVQNAEAVPYVKSCIAPTTQCYLLTLQFLNLYCDSYGNPCINNGIMFCKHSIFMKNIVSVTLI